MESISTKHYEPLNATNGVCGNGTKVAINVDHQNAGLHHKSPNVTPTLPVKRHEVFKWDGWGFLDSGIVTEKDQDGGGQRTFFSGSRYGLENSDYPEFLTLAKKLVGLDFDHKIPKPIVSGISEPNLNHTFLELLQNKDILLSTNGMDRLVRSHGQSCAEVWDVRNGATKRLVDAVVWPKDHEDVLSVISAAVENNVVIIPVGGATNVSGALLCPPDETRMVVSLDTTQMCKMLWINEDNLTAHFQVGVVGQDLENVLTAYGYCCGHEPDSMEFSTLGGWIATRAAGMKRHLYGNIEDIVVNIKMATSIGTIEKNCWGPRISSGPDVQHFILGSEGTLGVITEATIKIRPLPEVKKYGSYVFPTFEDGVGFYRDLAKEKCTVACVRLMDNIQLQMGKALKQQNGYLESILAKLKMAYLVHVKGLDLEQISAATLLYEGEKESVLHNERRIHAIACRHSGISGGEEFGRSGFKLTYVIAYLRDFCSDYYVTGDSFETSVPWDRVIPLCRNVKDRLREEYAKRNLKHYFSSCRLTQAYDAGVCAYFYSAFCYYDSPIKNPALEYESVERIARQEVIENGGSISHHHGVGKLQKPFLQKTISKPGLELLKAIKERVDPQNIFANGNLMM